MHRRLAILAVGLLMFAGAAPAADPVHLVTAPTTAPVDDTPLPARHSVAATQSTTSGRASAGTSDPLDMKRMGIALAIVLGAMYVTHLVWKRLTGDFILTARARLLGTGGQPHRKLGWTARASLAYLRSIAG